MEFFPGKKIYDSNLLEINIAEDDYPEYDPAETVGLGALRQFVDTNIHEIYKSTVDDNVGNPLTDGDSWKLVNTTNAYRMFDNSIASQSEHEEFIRFKLGGLGRTNALYLGNLDATNVQVIIRNNDNDIVYDQTFRTIKKTGPNGFFKYFFGERVRIRDLYVPNLPYYFNQTIEIIINKPNSIAKCGVCVVGKAVVFGDSQLGLTMGIDDYTVKKVDEDFGFTTLVQRDYRKYNDLIVEVPNNNVDEVFEALADARGSFCVFVGTRKFTSAQAFGFFENFKIAVEFQDTSLLYLSVKGIT